MSKKSHFWKALGPGLLFAGAAIGVSHLVQSTRAGANYGFALFWLVIITNFLKFPFFEFGHRYTAATGDSLLSGYRKLGSWALPLFLVLSIITSFINMAVITLVTAGLAEHLFQTGTGPVFISSFILALSLVILAVGKYSALDKLMKTMIILLAITTITALVPAVSHGMSIQSGFVPPDVWTLSSMGFLLALMGWMPAPIEVSVWSSLWSVERKKQTNHHPSMKHALTDFYIGYVGTAVMALIFLSLGALVMYGSGEVFSNSGVQFSGQLVSLYSRNLGDWSRNFIAAAALITMFSTTITVIDAYPRTLSGSLSQLFPSLADIEHRLYWIWLLVLAAVSLGIIAWYQQGIKSMVDLATILAFIAAPVFAIINYRVVTAKSMPEIHRPPAWLRLISWCGMVFLTGFGLLYGFSRIVG